MTRRARTMAEFEKIQIMEIFNGAIGGLPFPRSEQAIRTLAAYRRSQAGKSGKSQTRAYHSGR